jgi:hypothetical protein
MTTNLSAFLNSLSLARGSDEDVVVYVDAFLGGDLDKKNLTSGIIGFLRDGPVLFLWASRKQTIATSMTNYGFLSMTENAV